MKGCFLYVKHYFKLIKSFHFFRGTDYKTISRQRQPKSRNTGAVHLLSAFQNHDLPISINFADRPGGNQVISTLFFFPVWLEPGHRYLWMLIQQPGQHPELPVQFCLDALVQLFFFAAGSTAPPPEGPHRSHSRLQREKTAPPGHGGASEGGLQRHNGARRACRRISLSCLVPPDLLISLSAGGAVLQRSPLQK